MVTIPSFAYKVVNLDIDSDSTFATSKNYILGRGLNLVEGGFTLNLTKSDNFIDIANVNASSITISGKGTNTLLLNADYNELTTGVNVSNTLYTSSLTAHNSLDFDLGSRNTVVSAAISILLVLRVIKIFMLTLLVWI